MLKKASICCPTNVKTRRRMKPMRVAEWKMRFLCCESIRSVKPIKIGMFPKGSTTMKRASTALTKFGMLSVREAINGSDVNAPSSIFIYSLTKKQEL
jgi:hypothetical protein